MHKIVVLLLSTLLFLSAPGFARESQCPDQPDVFVTAASSEWVSVVCTSAGDAIDFLAGFDLHPQKEIRFRVVDRELISECYDVYGRYDSRTDTIELMSYETIFARIASPVMYGEPFDATHYAGAIAHEVAHAVMQHNLMTELISPAPQEYLAHAVQMALMPEERRERILESMNVGPWESGDAISDIYMAIEPGKFAAKSYLHLTTMKEPEAFVRILLNANWFYVYVP